MKTKLNGWPQNFKRSDIDALFENILYTTNDKITESPEFHKFSADLRKALDEIIAKWDKQSYSKRLWGNMDKLNINFLKEENTSLRYQIKALYEMLEVCEKELLYNSSGISKRISTLLNNAKNILGEKD
jgi:hypothetical protein